MVFEKCSHVHPKLAMCDFYPEHYLGKTRSNNDAILADFARLGLFVYGTLLLNFPRDDYRYLVVKFWVNNAEYFAQKIRSFGNKV